MFDNQYLMRVQQVMPWRCYQHRQGTNQTIYFWGV